MKKVLLSLVCIASLALTACSGSDAKESASETQSSDSSQESSATEKSSDQTVYEIGETADLIAISNLAETTYDLTLDSVEFGQEYDGEPLSEFFINAPEGVGLLAVNLTMKNTGDEAYSLDMTLEPTLANDLSMAGETPIEWFEDKGMAKEVAPGAEEPITLVFILDTEGANEDGDFFLQFEIAAKKETFFRIPLSALN